MPDNPLEKWADAIRLARSTGMMPGIVEIADHAAALEVALKNAQEAAQTFRELLAEERTRVAALVQAAEAIVTWADDPMPHTVNPNTIEQLRIALDAVRTGGNDGATK